MELHQLQLTDSNPQLLAIKFQLIDPDPRFQLLLDPKLQLIRLNMDLLEDHKLYTDSKLNIDSSNQYTHNSSEHLTERINPNPNSTIRVILKWIIMRVHIHHTLEITRLKSITCSSSMVILMEDIFKVATIMDCLLNWLTYHSKRTWRIQILQIRGFRTLISSIKAHKRMT